ncbi:predicted protein [Micromonas commoda]|uniref:Uncharacterized protein n=1 Tax=Micromonas commoda (strain RCC299 / NOUM17 / CCMP2709) TaxID=296587 RepID=C1E5J8_MICCC|nr:predicted protein [Micromonas commoda]ACO63644.1 predicted protein [Micromonas commoda]|eukprot:XP_002502386.1 predicted protein [Micromonas commoda]
MSDKENKPKRGTVPTAAPSYGPNPAPVATVVQYPATAHQNPYEIHQGGYPRGALGVSPGLHAPPPFLPPPTYPPLWPMGDTRGIHTRMMHPDSRAYTSNLFDCFDDLPTCLGGTFCTPCQVGRAASDAKAGDCCATGWIILGLSQLNQLLPGLGNVASGGYLAHIANRAASNYGIQEHTDVLTACFCAPCVSCRLAREVKNRAEMGQEPVDWRLLAAAPPGAYSAPAAPVMDAATQRHHHQAPAPTRRAAPVEASGSSAARESVVTYVAVVDSPAGEYGVARPNGD